MECHPFTSTVARHPWRTPMNHGRSMRPASSIITPDAVPETLAMMQARCAEKIDGQDYYRRLRESGVHYGPFFQSIAQLWRNNGDVLGEVQVPDGPEADFTDFQIHPAILDAGLQVLGAAVAAEAT